MGVERGIDDDLERAAEDVSGRTRLPTLLTAGHVRRDRQSEDAKEEPAAAAMQSKDGFDISLERYGLCGKQKGPHCAATAATDVGGLFEMPLGCDVMPP